MRLTVCVAVAVTVLTAAAALAQSEALEKSCESSRSDFAKRLADCTALIEDESYPKKAWAHERRGDAYEDNDDYDAALADYDRALEIEPQHNAALSGRVYALSELDRAQEALPDILLLQEIEPDDAWNFYFHGVLLADLGQRQDALKPLDHAIQMNPENYYYHYERGKAHDWLEHYPQAISDFHAASQARPFSVWPYMRLSLAYLAAGDTASATKHYRMMQIIDPNRTRISRTLAELVKVDPEIALPPVPYQKPLNGLKIRYLQSFMPIDTRDEMEQAIGDLASWFKAPPKAMPEALAFISREISYGAGETLRVTPTLETGENTGKLIPNGKLPPYIDTYRGLFLTGIRPDGEGGPNFSVVIDTENPGDIWPLKVGNAVNGTGRMLIICPDEFLMAALLVGCKYGVKDVTMGKIEYSLVVEKAEQVHVPMGQFDTFVLRYRQLGRMQAFGREISRDLETRWWFSPELGFWVKRTNQRGDKIANVYAVEMVEE